MQQSRLQNRWSPSPRSAPYQTVKFFTGEETHFVTLGKAIEYVKNYRKTIQPGDIKGGRMQETSSTKFLHKKVAWAFGTIL